MAHMHERWTGANAIDIVVGSLLMNHDGNVYNEKEKRTSNLFILNRTLLILNFPGTNFLQSFWEQRE